MDAIGRASPENLAKPTEVVREVLRAIGTKRGLSPALQQRLLDISEGLTNKQIAQRHEISVNTVKTQVTDLLGSFALRSRQEIRGAAEAATRAAAAGASVSQLETFLALRFQ